MKFTRGQNETPALVPDGVGIGIDMARGFDDAVLTGGAEEVVRPPAVHLRPHPVFLNQTKERGAHQSSVQGQRLKQLDQAAHPNAAAPREEGVSEYRNDQRTRLHARLLTEGVDMALDKWVHKYRLRGRRIG